MTDERAVWHRGNTPAISQFGASAPADVLFDKCKFTVDHVVARVKILFVIRLAA